MKFDTGLRLRVRFLEGAERDAALAERARWKSLPTITIPFEAVYAAPQVVTNLVDAIGLGK